MPQFVSTDIIKQNIRKTVSCYKTIFAEGIADLWDLLRSGSAADYLCRLLQCPFLQDPYNSDSHLNDSALFDGIVLYGYAKEDRTGLPIKPHDGIGFATRPLAKELDDMIFYAKLIFTPKLQFLLSSKYHIDIKELIITPYRVTENDLANDSLLKKSEIVKRFGSFEEYAVSAVLYLNVTAFYDETTAFFYKFPDMRYQVVLSANNGPGFICGRPGRLGGTYMPLYAGIKRNYYIPFYEYGFATGAPYAGLSDGELSDVFGNYPKRLPDPFKVHDLSDNEKAKRKAKAGKARAELSRARQSVKDTGRPEELDRAFGDPRLIPDIYDGYAAGCYDMPRSFKPKDLERENGISVESDPDDCLNMFALIAAALSEIGSSFRY